MEIRREHRDGVVVLTLIGTLDSFSTAAFLASLSAVSAQEPQDIIVDAGGLDGVSSAGLKGLVHGFRIVVSHRRSLVLAQASVPLVAAIEAAGVDAILPLEDDIETALAELRGRPS